LKNEKGQSLFEIVVSLAISTLIIVSLVSLASTSIRNSTYSRNNTIATRSAQQAIEWLRGERDTDWDTFYDRGFANSNWCLPTLDWGNATAEPQCLTNQIVPDTIFYREVIFTPGSVDVLSVTKVYIDVKVKVYWTDAQGLHEVSSSTRFSDWRDLQI
jgi:type II secretory pathway pseudopilin PulG